MTDRKRLTLAKPAARFVKEKFGTNGQKKTENAYRNTAKLSSIFKKSRIKTYLDQATNQDVTDFIPYLRRLKNDPR